MPAPFKSQQVHRPFLPLRILPRVRKQLAVDLIQKALADAPTVSAVSTGDVSKIASSLRVPKHKLTPGLVHLYEDFFRYCLVDHALSNREIQELDHLRHLFGIRSKTALEIRDRIGREIYGKAISDVLKDKQIDEAESRFLQALERQLSLPPEIAEEIRSAHKRGLVAERLGQAVEDQRFSEQEEEELALLASQIGLKLVLDDRSQGQLDRYRLLWLAERGEAPPIDVEIRLQRGERCFFATKADWNELRTVTRRIRYSGPTARIKIVKGVYWRAGDIGVSTVKEDVVRNLDFGDLYLTNKRILFKGERQNRTILLSRIIDFAVFSDAVQVEKDRGRSPILAFDGDTELFGVLLQGALDAL